MTTLEDSAAEVRAALAEASKGLVEREALVELIALAVVAGEHLLVIGPPGTAKSEAVRRVARCFGGSYFEYLLGRFTEPNEIFGPVDLRKLREGLVETETRGMLPEADVAFLDEVFLGSTAILNTLLAILNERTFRRGHTDVAVPLRVCVGASNTLPDEPSLAAFADRFLLRVFIESVPDPRLEELLVSGWSLQSTERSSLAPLEALDHLARETLRADLSVIQPRLAQMVRMLRSAGVMLSDRRVVKLQRLVAAAAALAGRAVPGMEDLWPVLYAVPTADGQHLARDVLREVLEESENEALSAAAAEASSGPAARASRIIAAGRAILDQPPDEGSEDRANWRLMLEGVAREIDAGFAQDQLTVELQSLRDEIVAALKLP